MDKPSSVEFKRFDAAMKKILSVSRDELLVREKEWRNKMKKKKRAKVKPASPVPAA
jgi:hypothetical protein